MKYFRRLLLCYQLLRCRRAVVLMPAYPTLNMAIVGEIPPHAWEAIIHYSVAQHNEAIDAANTRLLAAIHATPPEGLAEMQAMKDEAIRVAKLEAEIEKLLRSDA